MCACKCEVEKTEKLVQYECNCETDCKCPIIEFNEEPKAVPYCYGVPMKRVK